ncbi:hypothetical protein P170DRAFT_507284 [Aspergillus steynii IBT 23096]|uniref:Mid2 domain-containing protein n=1 Tax=Aspergillus steynii IBT 23096 TaxID=1392250 RepID=A0A2I2GI22_9EURO|nr:uncharacterized protein P170DRAFT_507284 [Aspergillus steynii IBT 23096]PLB52514.1 hypothetical protein P170DRAFT_507284 [Aspergillus steynii IBT 23096]
MRVPHSYYPQSPMFAALLLFCSSTSVDAAKCYNPNGELAPNDQPCFPQNPVSACCGGSTFVCSTNNMCAHYSGQYFVIGSCTDKAWNSPACPGYCFFRDHIHNSVFRCSADTYCCADGPACNCTTGRNTQDIADFLPPYSHLVGSDVRLNTAVATSSLFTPVGASKPITSAPASTAERSFPATSVSTTTSSSVFESPARSSLDAEAATASPIPSPSPPEGNQTLKIGLGVGMSLGGVAVFLLVLLGLLWRRSKRNKRPIAIPRPEHPYPYQTRLSFSSPSHPRAQAEVPGYLKSSSHHLRASSAELPVYEAPGHGM